MSVQRYSIAEAYALSRPQGHAAANDMTSPGFSLLRRTMDAAGLNAVVNHPAVRPDLGGEGDLDLTGLIDDVGNLALVNDFGGFLLHRLDAGLYEAHTQFLPEGRGPAVVAAAIEGFRYLFTATDCLEVVTKVPDGNAPALGLARAVGFRKVFDRVEGFARPDGSLGPCSYYALTLNEWRARDPVIAFWGERFHDQLGAAKAAAGSPLPAHGEDEAHDRAVGVAYLMVLAGNAAKAVWTYNRWAVFAGYAPISLISDRPPVLDVQDAIVTLRGQDLEILKCR